MIQRILAIIVIVVVVLGGGYYAYQQLVPPPDQETGGIVYATKAVARGDISVGVEVTGPLNPSRGGGIQVPGQRFDMPSSSPTTYIISEVFVKEGDSVKQGQLLFKLAAPDLKTQLDAAQSQLKAEQEQLADLLGVPADQLDRIDPSRGITLFSPIDGRVMGLTVREGQSLKQGEIVTRVVNDAKYILTAKVLTGEMANIVVGQDALLSFAQFDGTVKAKITDVNPNAIAVKASDLMDSIGSAGGDEYVFVHWVTLEGENPGLIHPGMMARVGVANNPAKPVDAQNLRYLRYYTTVEGFAQEERVLSRADAIVTRVFVRDMAVVKKGAPLISLAGDDARKTIQEKVAKIRQFEQSIQQIRSQFTQLEVVSPMDGVVAQIDARPGRTVQAGEWLGHIYNTDDMRLSTNIDDIDILMVKQGSPVRVSVDAVAGKFFEGEVVHVSTMGKDMDGITRFWVEIKVAGSAEMRPGMNARGFIDAGRAENVLLVPLEAIFEEDSQPKVEVLDPDGSVRLVAVRIGLMNNRFAEIKEGLNEGELVITGSTADLLPSQRIQSKESILPERPKEETPGEK